MKNNLCSKCGSNKIRNTKKMKSEFISMQVPLTDSSLNKPIQATYYVCVECGYIETYIEDKKALKAIENNW